jgi:ribokinase
MPSKIVVVGSFNADLVTYLQRLPSPGETVHGHRFTTGPGGKGSNQAVAAARLGSQVTFIGRVGQDALAEIGLTLWKTQGIDSSCVERDADHATGVAVIFVEDSGQNVIVVTLGANDALSPADIDRAEAAIASADFLLTQLETNLDTVSHALKVARRHGVRTMLNPAPARELPADLLANVDYLTPNEHELAIMGGRGAVEDAARSLLQRDDQTLIVTLGAKGAQWITRSGSGIVPAYPVDVVDTVGAGDAFCAGLAVALAEGKPLEEALRFANATGAMSVTRPGAASSMPQRQEVDAFLERVEKS